ncbi:MAG TPA: patatin-like phospholipase family protein [Candidatus Saccharimonadales bacterium]|nr:patatin-like phospholipase family protein [Candidatus Saccharimonadales bacterium]
MKASSRRRAKQPADIIMEGGGVKGIGLLGALEILEKHYEFRRIAGSSVGALVGALIASGMTAKEAKELLRKTSLKNFRDPNFLSKLGPIGQGTALLFKRGLYKGDALHNWIFKHLQDRGIHTFADLKLTDEWAKALPPRERYKLVVLAADISRGRLLRLPWDYRLLGRNPDKQLVADAIRASVSIPFFYEPVKFGRTVAVDGALLSNFPITLFDAPTPAAWPTFGIKLSSHEDTNLIANDISGPFGFPLALLDTLINGYDRTHLNDPATTSRTNFIDAAKIKVTDFDITKKQRDLLCNNGRDAAQEFLKTWDFNKYITRYIKPRYESTKKLIDTSR